MGGAQAPSRALAGDQNDGPDLQSEKRTDNRTKPKLCQRGLNRGDAREANNSACWTRKAPLYLKGLLVNVLTFKGKAHHDLVRDNKNLTISKINSSFSQTCSTYAFPTTLIINNPFYCANILESLQTPFFLNSTS